MKITKDHYEIIENAINKVIMDNPCAYDDYQKKGLSDMRYRWDCLWAAKLNDFIRDIIYQYANDNNIDTVLRKITKKHAMKLII